MTSTPWAKNTWTEGRMDPRIPTRIELHIRKADDSNVGEALFTENISANGAGFQTGTSWKPGEMVLLKALHQRFMAQGRIVYCLRIKDGKFAVGVKVISTEEQWSERRDASLPSSDHVTAQTKKPTEN